MNLLTRLSLIFTGQANGGLSVFSWLADHVVSTQDKVSGLDILGTVFTWIGSFLYKILYAIVSFLLSIIDFIQLVIYKIMGIGTAMGDEYVVFDDTNPLIKMLTNEYVIDAFIGLLIFAVVVIIVYTIFAIIMSEYKAASSNGENSKGRILGRTLRSFLTLTLFPVILVGGIIIVNALLAGFNNVFYADGASPAGFGTTIFVTSSYEANRYRMYGQSGVRVPILVDFDDPYHKVSAYTEDELYLIYSNFEDSGKEIYSDFVYEKFDKFNETLVYDNNTLYNASSYAGFEKFLCTPEQYLVMADFIEYAFQNNLQFYIKSIKDADIDWKYVNQTIFDKENSKLTITYKDASNISGETHYTVAYIPTSTEISTPIADAFDTISNMLAIGDYADNEFNILNRQEDSINIVFWETDQVLLKLSNDYRNNPTYTDLLILFEKYRYDYNNTLDFSIEELQNGVTLPALSLEKRTWRPDYQDYYTYEKHSVVEINGSFYKVEKTNEINEEIAEDYYSGLYEAKDGFSDYYFTLDPILASTYSPRRSATDISSEVGEGNSICISVLNNDKYLGFIENHTFADYEEYKLNGVYENVTTDSNGSPIISYGFYDDKVTKITKKVNWPQKLMNDMRTVYADINVNLLLTSGDWLTKLSTIVGTTSNNGEFGQTFDTSLIHPLGLMLSELFLNEISDANNSVYGDYQFTSSLNEQEIRSILLSVCGEDDYLQLSKQVEYFVEIFNAYMGPVLDDIAYMENFELMSGNLASEQLYTYRAYLCSLLLSSSCARYLFNSSAAIVGANDFAYAILEYDDIIETIVEQIQNGEETPESHSVYFHVTISGEDYKRANNASGEFGSIVPAGEYSYSDYETTFNNIPSLFTYSGEHETYNAIDVAIEDSFSFANVIDYSSLGLVIARIKENAKIVVTQGDYTQVNNIVASLFKTYSALEWDYQRYINNPTITEQNTTYGIYQLILQEMEANKNDAKEPDFEYITSLGEYIDGTMLRWEFVKSADTTNVSGYKGTLSKLKESLGDSYDKVSTVDYEFSFKNLLNVIESIYSTKKSLFQTLNYLYEDMGELEGSGYTGVVQPETSPEEFAEMIYGILRENGISMSIEEFVTQIFDVSEALEYIYIFDDIVTLMEIANTNGQAAIKATYSLYELVDVFHNYASLLSSFDFSIIEEKFVGQAGRDSYRSIAAYMEAVQVLREAGNWIEDYLIKLNKIDSLNKYYITDSVASYVSTHLNTEFEVVVNNKHYTVGSNFTSAKLAEYVLGGDFLSRYGYNLAFVDSDYKGLLDIDIIDNTLGSSITNYRVSNSFSHLRDFLIGFGETSTQVYNISNFNKLAESSLDELVIGEDIELIKYALKFIVDNEYLPADIVAARFGLDYQGIINAFTPSGAVLTNQEIYQAVKTVATNKINSLSYNQEAKDLLDNVYGYLFINDKSEEAIVSSMSLKELRTYTINFIINYEKLNETEEQNQKRYLALFNLACSDWTYDAERASLVGATFVNDFEYKLEEAGYITGLAAHNGSMGVVLKLAGIENRPYEELIDLEYTIDFDNQEDDEANGDLFVICTFDETLYTYVPFLMTNHKDATGNGLLYVADENGDMHNWLTKYGYKNAVTEYYIADDGNESKEVFYPILARGGFDSNGNPTAIRKNGNDIEFYREDVVIRNASSIKLDTYYMTVEDMEVHYGLFGRVVNFVTKLFSGKSLTEHLVQNIPRIAITSNAKLPYGVDENVVEGITNSGIKLSFAFGAGSVSIDTIYDTSEINVLILLFISIMMFGFIFKTFWGVISRLIEITILFILGPAAISTISLKSDVKDEEGNYQESGDGVAGVYDKWKKNLIERILLAFGYIFGLNIFYVLSPMVSNVKLFTSVEAFANVPLLNMLPLGLINALGTLVLIVALAWAITYAPTVFTRILDVGDAFTDNMKAQTRVKNTIEEVKDSVSGQRAIDAAKDLKDDVKKLVPGMAMMTKVNEKLKQYKTKAEAKALKAVATYYGMSPELADRASKAYEKAKNQEVAAKKEREKKRKEEKKERDKARDSWG